MAGRADCDTSPVTVSSLLTPLLPLTTAAVLDSHTLRHVVFRGAAPPRPVGRHTRPASASIPVTESTAAATPLGAPLAEFYERLFARANLRADRYRDAVLRRREVACLRAVGVRDLSAASALLERDPAAVHRALHAVAIGVTSFFRDPAVFASLESPLRELAEARAEGVRVLSVGCSDGRELYSVAMLLDALGIRSAALDGVDCRESAVRAAAAGVYPASQVEGIPTVFRTAGFVASPSCPDEARVRPELRARCRWQVADAFTLPADGDYDVVLCRNLLIYLTPDAAAELWLRLRDMLAPGGILVVGKAERPSANVALHRIAPSLYQKREPAS